MNDLEGFPHEMLREIYEQPAALRRTVALYLDGKGLRGDVADRLAGWSNPSGELLIAASGSSRHSGLAAEILLEDLCGLAVDVEYSSEYSSRGGSGSRRPAVIVISNRAKHQIL
jgi:glucosamine--fructose-6-phosphate aminotransferase (isomerizing)